MIAVISDSHLPSRAEKIPRRVLDIVEKADKVVHCGDFATKDVHNRLEEKSCEFYAVKGNCEQFRLPSSETFSVNSVDFGVYHGTGINPRGHHPTLVRVANDLNADVLFHGHTHEQEAVKKDGKILLNPGSCTGVGGGSSDKGTPKMIIVEVEDEKLEVELIEEQGGELERETKIFEV